MTETVGDVGCYVHLINLQFALRAFLVLKIRSLDWFQKSNVRTIVTSSILSASFVVEGAVDVTKLGVVGAESPGDVRSANNKHKRHI